eukprot:2272311-Prymnesium_polylepis.1
MVHPRVAEQIQAHALYAQQRRRFFVVDCGSRHTEVHHLLISDDGAKVTELGARRLRSSSNANLPLSDLLPEAKYRDELLPTLQKELVALGWADSRDATVFVGATGGVRAKQKAGEVTDKNLAGFEAALKAALKARHSLTQFVVLSGDQEAQYELAATRLIFSPTFEQAGKGKPFLLSGGGATCQFAYGDPVQVCSLDAALKDCEERVLKEGRTALDAVKAHYETVVGEWWPRSGLSEQLNGSFVGIAMHEDVVRRAVHCSLANEKQPTSRVIHPTVHPLSQAQLGFSEAFCTPPEVIAKIDQIEEDLFAQSGDGWDKALAKWGERATRNWPIGVTSGLRLRAILQRLADTSTLYFAKTAPNAGCSVSWPVGVVAIEAQIRTSLTERPPLPGALG